MEKIFSFFKNNPVLIIALIIVILIMCKPRKKTKITENFAKNRKNKKRKNKNRKKKNIIKKKNEIIALATTATTTAATTVKVKNEKSQDKLICSHLKDDISSLKKTITDLSNSIKYLATSKDVNDVKNKISNQQLTFAEFKSSKKPENTDIVDTLKNIRENLAKPLHPNIRSINVFSGDTLFLTTNEFKNLLEYELPEQGYVLFSGKINIINDEISGTYTEVEKQITDYRIKLVENFDPTKLYLNFTGLGLTVGQIINIKQKGFLLRDGFFAIKDTLESLATLTDSNKRYILGYAKTIEINNKIITSEDFDKLNSIANLVTKPITATVSGTGAELTNGSLRNLAKIQDYRNSHNITFKYKGTLTTAQLDILGKYTNASLNPLLIVPSQK